jgi:hypothetical protein
MNTFKSAALAVLGQSGKPLHYREITKRALEAGLLETHGATPEMTMNAQIVVDIRAKGNESDFVKTAPATYGLNTKKAIKHAEPEKVSAEEAEIQEKEEIAGGFTGRAGEHLVCSELLFRGFNASIMSVDVGLDIVATKESKMFGIQVKTSNLNTFDMYVFDVRKVSFDRHNVSNTFYVFVLRGDKETHHLVLPSHEMSKKVHEGAIRPVGQGKKYRVNIKFRNNHVYLGTKDHAMDYYLDNWDIIK